MNSSSLPNTNGSSCYIIAVLHMLIHSQFFMSDVSNHERDKVCSILLRLQNKLQNKGTEGKSLRDEMNDFTNFLLGNGIIESGSGDSYLFLSKLFEYFCNADVEIPCFRSVFVEKKNCKCDVQNVLRSCHLFQVNVNDSLQNSISNCLVRNERGFVCKRCHSDAKKGEYITEPPQNLLLCANCESKEFSFRVMVDFKLFLEHNEIATVYTLSSFVVHTGYNHYHCYVKKEDSWFFYDGWKEPTLTKNEKVFSILNMPGNNRHRNSHEKYKKFLILLFNKVRTYNSKSRERESLTQRLHVARNQKKLEPQIEEEEEEEGEEKLLIKQSQIDMIMSKLNNLQNDVNEIKNNMKKKEVDLNSDLEWQK